MSDPRVVGAVTERDWQGFVVTLAEWEGWLVWHDNDSRKNRPGLPDLFLVRPPDLLVVELKTERGKVTQAQQVWLDALEASGVETHVWRPSDQDEVAARLQGRRIRTPARPSAIYHGDRVLSPREVGAAIVSRPTPP